MEIILIVIIIYQMGIIYFLGKGRLWGELKDKIEKPIESLTMEKIKSNSIMGKTKTQLTRTEATEAKYNQEKEPIKKEDSHNEKEVENKQNYSKVVEKEEYGEVFSNTPLDVDIEAEYKETTFDEVTEEEDIDCSTDEKDAHVAKGLSYDELAKIAARLKGKFTGDTTKVDNDILSLNESELLVQLSKGASIVSSTIDDAIRKNSPKAEKRKDLDEKYKNFKIEDIV